MAGNGTPPKEPTYKLKWRCGDVNCDHLDGCRHKVLWTDTGYVAVNGEMIWNVDDHKWDWSVRVDHYGSSEMTQAQVEAMTSRYARRMASQVGMVFRGPKVVSIADVED